MTDQWCPENDGAYRAEMAERARRSESRNGAIEAAAPDLLEACKGFVRKVEAGEAKSKRSYRQMKDAIAKAEGKQ